MTGDRQKKGPRMAGGGQAGRKKVVTPSIAPRRSVSSNDSATPSDSTQEKFAMLPHRILTRRDLSLGAKAVYAAIRDRVGENGEAWPGQPTIAADCGVSCSTVQRAIHELVSAGLLKTTSRGAGRSLLYEVCDPGQSDSGQNDSGQNGRRGPVKMTGNPGQNDRIENQTHEPYPLNQTHERSTKPKRIKFSKQQLDSIYQAYPRKVGRAAALKAIDKALLVLAERGTQEPTAWLLERVEKYAASPAGRQRNFTPYPATWFNQARYDDDENEWANTNENARGQAASPARSRAMAGKYDDI